MDSSRNYVAKEITLNGRPFEVFISSVGDSGHSGSSGSEGGSGIPIYSVSSGDEEFRDIIESDRVQIVLANAPAFYKSLETDPEGDKKALMTELYRVVLNHHELFNP
jgi:hypothetical protein